MLTTTTGKYGTPAPPDRLAPLMHETIDLARDRAQLLAKLLREQNAMAEALRCTPSALLGEVVRIAKSLSMCQGCGRLTSSLICEDCLEDRRR